MVQLIIGFAEQNLEWKMRWFIDVSNVSHTIMYGWWSRHLGKRSFGLISEASELSWVIMALNSDSNKL